MVALDRVSSLQVEPWCDSKTWAAALSDDGAAGAGAARRSLLSLLQPSLGGYLWRTTKASVAHELQIPKQSAHVVKLDLNAIQKHELRRAVRDVCASLWSWMPSTAQWDAVKQCIESGVALPGELDREATQPEQNKVISALDSARKVQLSFNLKLDYLIVAGQDTDQSVVCMVQQCQTPWPCSWS